MARKMSGLPGTPRESKRMFCDEVHQKQTFDEFCSLFEILVTIWIYLEYILVLDHLPMFTICIVKQQHLTSCTTPPTQAEAEAEYEAEKKSTTTCPHSNQAQTLQRCKHVPKFPLWKPPVARNTCTETFMMQDTQYDTQRIYYKRATPPAADPSGENGPWKFK